MLLQNSGFHWKVDTPICHLNDIWSRRAFWVYFFLYLYPLRYSMDPVFTVSALDIILFTYAQYQLTNWQIRLFWLWLGQVWYLIVSIPDLCNLTYTECNMEDHLCSQLRQNVKEMCWFKVTFYNYYDLSSMLATKIHDLSSKAATSKCICWQRQQFFLYLSSLFGFNNFIKSNCGFNLAEM